MVKRKREMGTRRERARGDCFIRKQDADPATFSTNTFPQFTPVPKETSHPVVGHVDTITCPTRWPLDRVESKRVFVWLLNPANKHIGNICMRSVLTNQGIVNIWIQFSVLTSRSHLHGTLNLLKKPLSFWKYGQGLVMTNQLICNNCTQLRYNWERTIWEGKMTYERHNKICIEQCIKKVTKNEGTSHTQNTLTVNMFQGGSDRGSN